LGSIVFAKAVIPHMRKQGGGRILQISSEQSQMAYPGMSVYATTKWGIEGFFEGVIRKSRGSRLRIYAQTGALRQK
jgi:NADP-dependent 3-hydroxy acid dehydrogenase YdfG